MAGYAGFVWNIFHNICYSYSGHQRCYVKRVLVYTKTPDLFSISLRRHYPDQVVWVYILRL
jgi:hypothetical protein